MSESDVQNYQPSQQVTANTDVQALVQQLVQQELTRTLAAQQQAAQPRIQTPEEAARAALDNAGAGLGIEERLAELYTVVAHLASKVGI